MSTKRGKPKDRAKLKGRQESGTFLALPHHVLDSPNYIRLSGSAVKLLVDLGRQYNGRNNGDLTAALTVLRRRGWRSSETLNYAIRELRHYGFIELTRQGGLCNRPSLYALSWKAIDDCGDKLDVTPTNVASNKWREETEGSFSRRAKNQQLDSYSEAASSGMRSE